MGVVGIILLVAFVIICILMVCIVLIQNEEGGGLGGLFGGGANSSAFGSRSANVLTKTTYVLVTLFFLSSFGLALINKAPAVKNLDAAVQQTQEAAGTSEYWLENKTTETAAPAEVKSAETSK